MSEPNNLEWIDEILSEYFTWKGEAITQINQTANYKRMKLAITAKINEMQHLHEYAGNVDYCFICGLTPEQLIKNTVELRKRKDEVLK